LQEKYRCAIWISGVERLGIAGEFLAGVAGIVLGILALLRIVPVTLSGSGDSFETRTSGRAFRTGRQETLCGAFDLGHSILCGILPIQNVIYVLEECGGNFIVISF
jgi:hypothetical protein